MKLKDRIKTYNFWVSLASALFLIINLVGQKFNFHLDELLFSDILTTLCGILVLLGIIAPPTSPVKDKVGVSNIVPVTDDANQNSEEKNTEEKPSDSKAEEKDNSQPVVEEENIEKNETIPDSFANENTDEIFGNPKSVEVVEDESKISSLENSSMESSSKTETNLESDTSYASEENDCKTTEPDKDEQNLADEIIFISNSGISTEKPQKVFEEKPENAEPNNIDA